MIKSKICIAQFSLYLISLLFFDIFGQNAWTMRSVIPQEGMSSITYGNGMFVAVGYDGAILTSPNGFSGWVIQHSPVTEYLNSILWQNNLFVTVGEYGTILTSSDAISWTVRSSGTTDHFQDVAYGNGRFVAVGFTSTNRIHTTIATSSDGLVWTSQTIDSVDSIHVLSTDSKRLISSVAWGENKFVAVGDFNTMLTSPDGLSWTDRSSPLTPNLHRVAYGNNLFVASGDNDSLLTSPDGLVWTKRILSPGAFMPYNLQWCHDRFIALGRNLLMTSSDGITWTNQTLPGISTLNLQPITWGANSFIVGNLNTFKTGSSNNGTDWVLHPEVCIENINQIIRGKSQYVVIGDSGTILTSPDLERWDIRTSGTRQNLNAAAWNGFQFIIVGDSGLILTSKDGGIWTKRMSGSICRLSAIAQNGNKIVAVGARGSIAASTSGINWSVLESADTLTDFYDVCWNGNKFFAFGAYFTGDWIVTKHQSVFTSTDANNWKNELPAGALCADRAIWGGNQFVGIGGAQENYLLSSVDGIHWVIRDSITSNSWSALAWGKNTYVAGSRFGKVVSSSDGINWNNQTSDFPKEMNGIIFADSQFVAIAKNTIYTSSVSSRIHWTSPISSQKGVYLRIIGNSLEYHMPESSPVILKLVRIDGRWLKTLVYELQNAGLYQCKIPAGLAAGEYVLTLRTNTTAINRNVFVKK